jgi:hypothetical protein
MQSTMLKIAMIAMKVSPVPSDEGALLPTKGSLSKGYVVFKTRVS